MRAGIHPEYHEVEARCACGATWKARSTRKELRLEICSNCHPFFTGRQKLVDTEGRVERFTKKYGQQTVAALKARQQEARKAVEKPAAAEAKPAAAAAKPAPAKAKLPAAEAKPAPAKAKPPAAGAKPAASEAKPAAEAKPTADAEPAAEAKPGAGEAEPTADAGPPPDASDTPAT